MITPLLLHAANGPYRFHWDVHPDVIVFCIVLEIAYLYAVTRLRDVLSDARRTRRSHVALFSSGVLLIYIVAGTPIDDIEAYLLSFHMLQHVLLTLAVAPLLLAGTPAWVWQALLRQRGMLRVGKMLTHPVMAFAVFNATLLVLHLPFALDYSLEHEWFHFLGHAALVATAMLMWWPVLSAVPELPRISAPLQMAYLFVQSLLPSVMASFVTFADDAVYPFYERVPRLWGLSAQGDQQIAGGVMKLLGSIILWSFIGVVFFQWYNREQAADKEPHWREVEEELHRLGLTGE
jgi:putative membrane protein